MHIRRFLALVFRLRRRRPTKPSLRRCPPYESGKAPPRPPPELMDELVEEVLLRLPPDDPASLARAALVCRRWRRLISDPGFRRRLRDLHRPPMLGFLRNLANPDGTNFSRFVPTSSFRPPRADRRGLRAIDCRHGLVLLCSKFYPNGDWEGGLLVWDPVTDEDWEVPAPPPPDSGEWCCWKAAALCAAARGGGCSYIDCRRDPFLVVVVGTSYVRKFACVYSSEAGVWSEHTYDERIHGFFNLAPAVLVGDALYFIYQDSTMIFKYDVPTLEMSVIDLPDTYYSCLLRHIVLMTTEDGGLGFTVVEETRLFLYSREADSQGARGWSVTKLIKLDSLFPQDALWPAPQTVGFAECCGLILLWTPKGYFIFDPKSDQVTKVGEDENTISVGSYVNTFCIVSFCIPALGATSAGEGPKADDSCASTSKVASAKIL